jgi:glycosyltransferase involved in cell wall biosynthesis
VSVIIPVYNGADHVGDAVRSCLAQTYPRIEVIVVDDGSSDDLDAALASVADRILLLRQPNGGVASARNRGIRAARGELIHFLDTDDVLDPDCIERKVAALRCVPDAELCFSSYRAEGDDGYRSAVAHRVPPIGDAHCPTRDLLGTAVRRYAFHTSSVLVARWVLLETGPMDESLSRGSDTRYWFRLALRGTKVIGLRSPLDTRHFRAGSLTSYEEKHQRAWAVLFLLDLGDLLDRPSLWRYLGPLLRRMKNRTRWNLLEHLEDDQLERLRSALLSRIGRLGESRRFEDLSSRVPLRLIEAYVLSLDEVEGNPDRGAGLFRDRLVDVLRRAIPQTAEPALRDLHYWTEAVAPEDSRANRPAFLALFDWLNATPLRGTPAVAPRELPGLSRWAPEHPWRERWWLLALLDARGGEKWACRTVRRWDPLLRPSFQLRRFLRPRTRLRAVRARVQKPTAGPSAPSHPRSNG